MPEVVGAAEYQLGVDMKPLKKGLTDAEAAIKKSGATAESAFGKAASGMAKTDTQSRSLLGRMKTMASGGGIGGAILGGVGLGAGLTAFSLVERGIGAVIGALGDAQQAASELAEQQSKLEAVFDASADTINAWAETSATAMGLSQRAALEATGTLGNFLQAMGTTESESADMSMTLVQLAADLASFNNAAGGAEEVLMAIQSGLAGETEPMRRFGVDISDAAVQAHLLAQGIEKVGGAFTQTQKIQARFDIIMAKTTKAQGDYLRTATSSANQARTLDALQENLNARVGVFADQVVKAGQGLAIDMVGGIMSVIDALNNLRRFLDPAGAAIEDTKKSITGMVKEMELPEGSADAIVKWYEASLEAAGVAADLDMALGLMGATQEQVDEQMTESADAAAKYGVSLTDLQREYVRQAQNRGGALTGMMDEEDQYRFLADTLNETLIAMGLVTDAQGELQEASGETTKTAEELVAAFTELPPEVQAAWVALVKAGKEGAEELADGMVPPVKAAAQRVLTTLDNLPPSMAETIKSGKARVREAMNQLRFAMEHPFADDKFADWLEKRARNATGAIAQALRDGQVDAAAEAAGIRLAILNEISKLQGADVAFQIAMRIRQQERTGTTPGYQPRQDAPRRRKKKGSGRRGDGAYGSTLYDGDWGYVGEYAMERAYNVGGTTVIEPIAGGGRAGGTVVNISINAGAYLGTPLDAARHAQYLAPAIGRELSRIGM